MEKEEIAVAEKEDDFVLIHLCNAQLYSWFLPNGAFCGPQRIEISVMRTRERTVKHLICWSDEVLRLNITEPAKIKIRYLGRAPFGFGGELHCTIDPSKGKRYKVTCRKHGVCGLIAWLLHAVVKISPVDEIVG